MRAHHPGSTGLRQGIVAALLLSGCVSDDKPQLQLPSANEMIALSSQVIDCETSAANKSDNGSEPTVDVAEGIMLVCTRERMKARQAVHVSSSDPDADMDDLKRAVQLVEEERTARRHLNSN